MTPLNYYIPDTSNRINNRYVPNDPRLARADGARLQADATISARSGFPGKVERKNEGVPRCDESSRGPVCAPVSVGPFIQREALAPCRLAQHVQPGLTMLTLLRQQ